jgi:hypothetical protein
MPDAAPTVVEVKTSETTTLRLLAETKAEPYYNNRAQRMCTRRVTRFAVYRGEAPVSDRLTRAMAERVFHALDTAGYGARTEL